jgi:archaellum biogenesis ATPase FlaH
MRTELKTVLDYARWYVSKSFSVIPLLQKGKTPVIETWKLFQTHKPTDDKLKVWFGNGSDNNIGIVTGAISGITVVDFDSPESIEFSKKNNFPITPSVKTGKGYHAYYRYKEGVRNFQKRDDLPGIDLRGNGGYVVAPPSIHPSGHQYQWIKGKCLDDLPLADLPEIVLVRSPEDKTLLKELYKGVPEGSRNDSLTRLIGSLVNDGLGFDECLNFAYQWNERNNPPETDLKKIERTVRSIYEKHHREKNYKDAQDSEFDPIRILKKGSELLSLECNIEWIVDRLVPKQSITLLHGKGGIGKTWISLILANAVSKNIPFMDLPTQGMTVVFTDFENSLPVLVERVKKIGASDVLFWHNTNERRPPKLDREDWEQYKSLPIGLLIFDTLRASQSKDENSSQDMAFIMSRLKELRDMGFTIFLLHHTPKSNDRTYKGSTAIMDLADHVLSLHKVKRGSLEDVDDDDEEGYYRLGTKEKTRYEPFHIFLDFDPERGFVIAPDPDEEDIKEIHHIITELKDSIGELPIQSRITEKVKEELELSKSKIARLLRKGEGKYWNSKKIPEKKNAKVYEPISVFQFSNSIYCRETGKLPEKVSQFSNNNLPDNNQQSLDNPEFASFPEGVQKTEKQEVIDLEHEQVEIIE